MTTIIVFFLGAIGSYMSFRIGFRLGGISAIARMNAIVMQMNEVVQDIQRMNVSDQWTEDNL
jgi:hypothetical protein